jgi:hypothetical protein
MAYTKTDLVFGFLKNQILVAVIPGLENAEDFPRTKSAEDFPRTKDAEDFTRAKWFSVFSENYFVMCIHYILLLFRNNYIIKISYINNLNRLPYISPI